MAWPGAGFGAPTPLPGTGAVFPGAVAVVPAAGGAFPALPRSLCTEHALAPRNARTLATWMDFMGSSPLEQKAWQGRHGIGRDMAPRLDGQSVIRHHAPSEVSSPALEVRMHSRR